MSIGSILSGKTYAASDLGLSFASALGKRLQPMAEDSELDQAEAGRKASQLQKLESALAGTVAYMNAEHGQKAASTMIALVMKRIGDDEINEDNLGQAFLDVIRFVDTNFGTDKGDKLMTHLNGSLNRSMNEFFDNGLNETFIVAPTNLAGSNVAASTVSESAQGVSEAYVEAIKTLLESARMHLGDSDKADPYGQFRQDGMKGVLSDQQI